MVIKNGIDKVINRNTSRFFMPGHNGDKTIPLHYDVTETDGTDNLHNPSGIIRMAQLNASVVFGCLHSFFLVNGSSVGLHALIMSVCNRGDTLIVDRGCHISVINAMVLNDIRPVYIYPKFNSEFAVNTYISRAGVEQALAENPDAKGVLITSPNYYGICSDVYEIAQVVHSRSKVLIVDEAHGAHFPFNEELPQGALMCGADGVVQSAHKTLPCITQGAMLHLGTNRISSKKVGENLNMLQTTSPSYLIMMSIDEAIGEMTRNGNANLSRVIAQCGELKEKLEGTGKYKCLKNDDPTRLVINVGENAEAVQSRLRKQHNILIEMCDGQNLVLITKSTTKMSDFRRLEGALINIALKLPVWGNYNHPAPPKTSGVMPPSQAYYGKTEVLEPLQAVGRVAARAVYKTPPCVCILSPGEVVTQEITEVLSEKITVAVV